MIRWSRSDYGKLSYYVRQFNKKVKELESMEIVNLPKEYDYKELKNEIYTRRELNRTINSLKRFNKESQQRIVNTTSGEKITQWELSELKKSQKRSISRIDDNLRNIVESDINVIGDLEFKRLIRTRESINDLFNRTGSEFRRTAERTKNWGNIDFEYKRADTYRENFMKSLEELSDYDNYELLKNKLEKIKDPIKFYEYIKKSDILLDLFLFYKDKATSQTYGGFKDNQEAFNTALFDELGLEKIYS